MASRLPKVGTKGYTEYAGKCCCTCLAQWLPVLERLAIERGYIRDHLDVLQLTGNHRASAGVHTRGGAFDLAQIDPRIVADAREMGAPATWVRLFRNKDGSRNFHTHGVLSGCPHNKPARYQIDAQRSGFDGLGGGGLAGLDPHPRPKTYRTWRQGIEWANAQLGSPGGLVGVAGIISIPAPTEEVDVTPEQEKKIDYISAQCKSLAKQIAYVQAQVKAVAGLVVNDNANLAAEIVAALPKANKNLTADEIAGAVMARLSAQAVDK